MSRATVLMLLPFWAGTTLLLSSRPFFARTTLTARIRPYRPGHMAPGDTDPPRTAELARALVGRTGERLASAIGVAEDLGTRLERIHAPFDTTAFRVRQLGWAAAALAAGTATAQATTPAAPVLLLLVFGSPALAFLVLEQQIATASARWQRRLFLELPVVSEQLGMLLGAGYSLGAALNRVADRSRGACARDLQRVCTRIRQGVSEDRALGEWADLTDVDAVRRLVHVLTMNHETSDLGRLVAEEARAARAEAHRRTLETLEQRAQQVWIPVTVATLLPGVLFLAVPFIEAMRLFSSS